MLIKPIKIRMKNFICFEDDVFNFPTEGTHLILGKNNDQDSMESNGSGKTTIIDAVLYAITGKTFKGESADEVIMQGKDNCEVVFEFSVDEKKGFIKYKRKPKKLVFFDGNDFVKAPSVPELHKKIQEFFGLDYEVLSRFILIGENDNNKFSFVDSSDTVKKEILTRLVGADFLDLVFDDIKKEIKTFESENLLLNDRVNRTTDTLAELKEELRSTVEDHEDVLEEKVVKKKIISLKKKIEAKRESYEVSVRNVKRFQAKLEVVEEEMERDFNELENKFERYESERKSYEKKLDKWVLLEENLTVCPECGYKFSSKYDLKQIKGKIKLYKNKVEFFKSKISSLDFESVEKFFEKRIVSLNNKLSAVKEKSLLLKDDISSLKGDLTILRNELDLRRNFIEREKRRLKEQIQKLKVEKSSVLKKLDVNSGKLSVYKSLSYHFGREGFKNFLYAKKLELIEHHVNSILSNTTSGFMVFIDSEKTLKSGTKKSEIDIKISINNQERSYKKLSKGERRLIDLVFVEAISKLIQKKNYFKLLVFDEPFGGLDNIAKPNVINHIRESSEVPTLILSPENNLAEYFDGYFLVEKTDGVSTINER